MKRFLCGLVALGLFLAAAEMTKADYNFTTLDVPGLFPGTTGANGINNLGQIVGDYFAGGTSYGFLLSAGSYTPLAVPGSTSNLANGINAFGQIVGGYFDGSRFHGFLLSGGSYTTIDPPGSINPQPNAINASGQIVGRSNPDQGFLLSEGSYTTIEVPGSTSTASLGINDAGQIVGGYSDGSRSHGFLLSGGSYTTLDVPGALSTSPSGINNSGQIVGYYFDGSRLHGFLLSEGLYTTLDVPGSTTTSALGINDSGQIVGSYADASGNTHGFLATPVTPVTTFAWHGPITTITTGVTGNPSFVQATPGTYGTKGNYGLVVPLQSGGLAHFDRNNDDPNLPWNGPSTFATDQGVVDAVSLIQSNFSTQFVTTGIQGPGNLAVVARIGTALDYFYRDDVAFDWHGPFPITTGVIGVPSFVPARPGTFGTKGNYELVVPLQSGGIGHFYRDNDDPTLPWNGPFSFGTELGIVDAVSIVQSNFSTQSVQTGVQGPGNLAVVARVGTQLVYFSRDDVAPFAWHGPTMTIATGVTGNPCFVQAIPGTYGTMGNYELVVPLLSGGMAHFYRNNDDPNLPWTMTATFGTSLGVVGGVSLIQSNFSTAGSGPGNLAVVSVANNQLDYFYRDDQ